MFGMVMRGQKRPLLSPTMIEAARALAAIDQAELAAMVGVARKTISLVERTSSERVDARRRLVLERIRGVFETKFGMRFSFGDDPEGEGVYLAKAEARGK